MTYRRALAALEARQEAKIVLGLGRLKRVLARLGDPQESFQSLHVAGTNGKGSTCAILASVLSASGRRTGLYVSPHLVDVRERISVGGRAISRPAFSRSLARALKADKEGSLTYFELLTAAAFLHFRERRVEVAVLETGLGGRLDATNVVRRPLAAVISSIGYDHMNFLGETLPLIAGEKAGIIKSGRPVVCSALKPGALAVVRRRAAALRSPLTVVRRPWPCAGVDWRRGRQTLTKGSARLTLPLLGRRQGLNAALAQAALAAAGLDVGPKAWKRGLAAVRWPGRFEVRRVGSRTLILDGAHNPEAMAHLVATLKVSPWRRSRLRWIMGVLRDKDAAALLAEAAPFLKDVVTVRPPSPRALDPVELARLVQERAPRARVSVEPDAGAALREWRRRGPRVAVMAGSFYLVGRVSELLRRP